MPPRLFKSQYVDFDLLREPCVLLDAGSRIGEFTIPFLWGRTAHAICVEPYPPANRTLQSLVPESVVTVIEKALWTHGGGSNFRIYEDNLEANSLLPMNRQGKQCRNMYTPTITLDEILAGEEWVDFLKMDIEGAEFAVLSTSESLGEKVGQIAVELHYNLPDGFTMPPEELLDVLAGQGFEGFFKKRTVQHTLLWAGNKIKQ